jgi:hypothetical protein
VFIESNTVHMQPNTSPESFNIISWNMLVSNSRVKNKIIRPQYERLPIFIDTLKSFPGSLDVVGVQEASLEDGINSGVALAESLGFNSSFFYQHNLPKKRWARDGRGRRNEFIGMFGALVDHAEPIDIGDNRLAVMTTIGSMAIVNFHFRQGRENRQIRVEHARRILDVVAGFEQVALAGDTNENWTSPARQAFYEAGFESAPLAVQGELPMTYPTPPYHEIMSNNEPEGTLRSVVSIDEICVRGLTVADAGILPESQVQLPSHFDKQANPIQMPEAASDHYAVWATLSAA